MFKHMSNHISDFDVSQNGFPLSGFLNQRRFKLGNTARNLASQSLQRMPEFDKVGYTGTTSPINET